VLQIEAMAQASAILMSKTLKVDIAKAGIMFMSVDNAKFRKPVVPGDRLEIKVTKIKRRGNLSKYACVAMVDDAKVAEAEVTAMIINEGAAEGGPAS
jgi:3-hydroxyacyl-[acyl-carrier-protein] dehydratase